MLIDYDNFEICAARDAPGSELDLHSLIEFAQRHGTVVVARSIEELFMDCMDLEENARSLLYATALGPLLPLTATEVEQLRASYGRSDYRAAKIWEHYQHKGRLAGIL